MAVDCRTIKEQIVLQMEPRFVIEDDPEFCRVRTPFLYPDNTPITVFIAAHTDGSVEISDLGAASDYAFLHGVGERVVSTRIARIGRRFRMNNNEDELSIIAAPETVGDSVISLINAVQDVGYLVYKTPSSKHRNEFEGDLEHYLVQNGRRFQKHVTIPTRRRTRTVDFAVSGDGHRQLYLWMLDPTVSAVSTKADSIAMGYLELQDTFAEDPVIPRFAVLVNTRDSRNNQAFEEARATLIDHGPQMIDWEHRHEIEHLLVAA